MVCVTLWVILSPGLPKAAADIFWETGRLNTWQSLQELNHPDTLRGHREVTFQASIPQGLPGAKTQLSCCRELHLPGSCSQKSPWGHQLRWNALHVVYILVFTLLDSWAMCKTQYKNEATCFSCWADLEGAEGFQDVCVVEGNQLGSSGVRRGSWRV